MGQVLHPLILVCNGSTIDNTNKNTSPNAILSVYICYGGGGRDFISMKAHYSSLVEGSERAILKHDFFFSGGRFGELYSQQERSHI